MVQRGASLRVKSGKMAVICLSESGEVLMRGLELQHYLCCCWDSAAFKSTNTVAASTPSCSIALFLSVSLFHFSAVFSHSFTHTSLFLGLSPLCLTIFLSLWFAQSLQSSISLLFNIPSNYIYSASLCYSQIPLITLCIHHLPMLICWPWFCLHNLRHQLQFPVLSLTILFCVGLDYSCLLQFRSYCVVIELII